MVDAARDIEAGGGSLMAESGGWGRRKGRKGEKRGRVGEVGAGAAHEGAGWNSIISGRVWFCGWNSAL